MTPDPVVLAALFVAGMVVTWFAMVRRVTRAVLPADAAGAAPVRTTRVTETVTRVRRRPPVEDDPEGEWGQEEETGGATRWEGPPGR